MEPEGQSTTSEPQLPPKPTPEQVEEAERLLQQASLAKIRGQGQAAEQMLKEASEAAPGLASVHVALGDELWRRSQFSRARESYRLAHRLEPDNVAYETKWAESLVGSSGDPLAMAQGLSDSYASAKTAGCLSMLLPGLGQVVLEERRQGFTMILLWAGALTWTALTPNGLRGIPSLLGFKSQVESFNALVLVPMALAAFTWLWAVTSCSVRAKTMGPRTIDRPKPPGEGGFEI